MRKETKKADEIPKKKSIYAKSRKRFRVLFVFFILLAVLVFHSVFNDWLKIYNNVKEKHNLETKLNNLINDEAKLNSEVIKLQDKDYVLIYAREKFGYSKDGELIIKMNKNDKKSEN